MQYYTLPYNTLLHYTKLYCTVLYSTLLYSTLLYCFLSHIIPYCITLFCIITCIFLYYTMYIVPFILSSERCESKQMLTIAWPQTLASNVYRLCAIPLYPFP